MYIATARPSSLLGSRFGVLNWGCRRQIVGKGHGVSHMLIEAIIANKSPVEVHCDGDRERDKLTV